MKKEATWRGNCISFYNMERFQNKLGDLSPIEFRERVTV
ncbi:IS3 family transposase [Paenibacillus pabuli]